MSDPLLDEFLAEVNDKYYPQVMEGTDLMDTGRVDEGIEILARPLHTIKGVTGFMSGFEPASTFTHSVESYLKKIQAKEVEETEENIALAVRAVNMVFEVIDQIKNTGAPYEEETQALLADIQAAMGKKEDAGPTLDGSVEIQSVNGTAVMRVNMARIHLESHRAALKEALDKAPRDKPLLLDLHNVMTMNSTAWEDLTGNLGENRGLAAFGLNQALKEVLYGWGFDARVAVFSDESDFFGNPEQDGQEQ